MKILKNILKAILNTFLTTIIVVGLVFVILFCIGIQPYVVESGSMEPAIKTGSVCFINKKAKYSDMKIGDVIAFKISDKAFATHRVVDITDNGIETKGDANNNVDAIVTTEDNFVGKNIYSIPKVGYFIKRIQTKSGRIILITLIIVLFLAGLLIGEPSKKKKKTKEE